MPVDIGLISHGIAAAAFLALTALLVLSWRQSRVGACLVFACAMTAAWAAAVAYQAWAGGAWGPLVDVFEVLRSAGWLGFLLSVIFLNRMTEHLPAAWRATVPAVGAMCLVVIVVDLLGDSTWIPVTAFGFDLAIFGRLVLAVTGLLFTENLLRNTRPEHRWGIKFLCIGVGGLFAYDFFMFSDGLLLQRVSPDLLAARGVANAVIVPLIAVSARRNPAWSIDVFVSRQVVLHSATLIGAGTYLLAMAAAGYYLREVGGEWGLVFQAAFLFAAGLLLCLVMFSGSFRVRLKSFISTHFFSYKYDYRDEWLRFIRTISSIDSGDGLAHRVIQGIADIVESTDGAIWLRRDLNEYAPLAAWNSEVAQEVRTVEPSFSEFLEGRQWVINLDRVDDQPEIYGDLVVPAWLGANRRGWLIVPLLHHDRLLGFLLLGRPRGTKRVTEEDYNLLKTVGRQAASYLAEQESARALAESRQFAEFNRRFAFVLHDIKNLVSQLSLLAQNAEKYRNNPEFQQDMVKTVKESVDKMNRLLQRLHQGGRQAAATGMFELGPALRKVIDHNAGSNGRLSLSCETGNIAVVGDEERFDAVIAHLVDNALDAAGADGRVSVRLSARGGEAIIEVADDGPGMDADFVRSEMFRPFRTTKTGGFGIGAYESREYVRDLGGRLDVMSRPGRGTIVRISLPAMNAGDRTVEPRQSVGVQ